jgi:hypothetical protein
MYMLMLHEMTPSNKCCMANITRKWPLSTMHLLMFREITLLNKYLRAHIARERLLFNMYLFTCHQISPINKCLITSITVSCALSATCTQLSVHSTLVK